MNKLDVTRMADRLTGLPNQAFRMVDALTRANKPYDLIYLPNRTHRQGANDGYTIKRTWEYFVEYLHGAAPVWGYRVEMHTPPAE